MKWWWQRRAGRVPKVAFDALEWDALLERSRSWDGFEREAAVVELCRRDDPRAIGALLVCCGDWVPQVRQAAQRGVRQFLREGCVPGWAAAWPELAFLQRVERVDVSALLAEIERFVMRDADVFESQARVSCGGDPKWMRWLFGLRLTQALSGAQQVALLCRGVQGGDLPLARDALQAARRLQGSEGRAVFEEALGSRLPRVRSEAARALLRLPEVDGQALLRRLCFDESATLRAMAAALLDGSGREAVAGRAAALLDGPGASPRRQVGALHVLSLLDRPAALARAGQRVDSISAGVRSMARGLRLLALKEDALDVEMMAALADPSAKVRQRVVELVRRGTPPPPGEALCALGLQRPELAVDVFEVLQQGSPWDRLGLALALMGVVVPGSALGEHVAQVLRFWSRAHFFVRPDARQRAWLAALWAGADTGRECLLRWRGPDRVTAIEARLRDFEVV